MADHSKEATRGSLNNNNNNTTTSLQTTTTDTTAVVVTFFLLQLRRTTTHTTKNLVHQRTTSLLTLPALHVSYMLLLSLLLLFSKYVRDTTVPAQQHVNNKFNQFTRQIIHIQRALWHD
jgi:hypothetical protein